MLSIVLLAGLTVGQTTEQCRDGFCPLPKTSAVAPVESDCAKYQWTKTSEDQYILSRDGVTVGQWYVPDHSYYAWKDGKNHGPVKPPIDQPTGRADAAQARQFAHWQMNGINADKMLNDKEVICLGGKVIHSSMIREAFDGTLTDDSSKGYLVIVAKDEKARQAIQDEFYKLPADFTSRYNVWAAPPTHFSMQDRFNGKPRFFTEGDPTIILQQADGTVLFRRPQANQIYKPGDFQDMLKSDPNYKPVLDPGAPPAPVSLSFDAKNTVLLVAAGVVLILILRRQGK